MVNKVSKNVGTKSITISLKFSRNRLTETFITNKEASQKELKPQISINGKVDTDYVADKKRQRQKTRKAKSDSE